MTDRLDKLIARDVHPAVHICCISCQTRSQLAVRGPGATSLYAWCCLGTVNTIYHAIDDGAATTIDRDPPCGARATIAAFSHAVAITVRGRGGRGGKATLSACTGPLMLHNPQHLRKAQRQTAMALGFAEPAKFNRLACLPHVPRVPCR